MLIYTVFAMIAMMGIASLAVDLGRVQLAKTEMEIAADAAARAATAYLPSDTAGARTVAISIAAQHTVDGSPLVLLPGDVVFGKWDSATKTMDTASASPDAVQIAARRTAARGTPIAMTLAKMVGYSSMDLAFTATAIANSTPPNYGILGLNSVSVTSGGFTGTFDSTTSIYTVGSLSHDGDVAGNSTMTLSADSSFGGLIYYNTASAPAGAVYSEGKTKMAVAATTPATPAAGSYLTSNSNAYMGLPTTGASAVATGPGAQSVNGGNYVLNSLNISNMTLTFTGPATIWIYGTFSASAAQFVPYQGKPTNLQVKFCTNTTMTLAAGSTLTAVVTAPTTSVSLTGSSKLVGSVVASSLSLTNSAVYYDKQLGPNGAGTSAGSSVVK